MKYDRNFVIYLKFDITISMCRGASIFSSDVTMMSYFNITINISIITNLAFSRVLKIFIILFSHCKFFVKILFHHFTTVLAFFNHAINKIVNIFTQVWLKRLTKCIVNTYLFIAITTSNMFLIFVCIRIFMILFPIILRH